MYYSSHCTSALIHDTDCKLDKTTDFPRILYQSGMERVNHHKLSRVSQNTVVGHTSFYAKMDLAKFGVLYKDRTPRYEGNIVEVDLANNSQNTLPIFNLWHSVTELMIEFSGEEQADRQTDKQRERVKTDVFCGTEFRLSKSQLPGDIY